MTQHSESIAAAVESGHAHSSLIASWRRCALVHGLHPDRTRPPERDLIALREAQTRDARMMVAARACLDELFAALDTPECSVGLSDKIGIVLDQRTGLTRDAWGRAASDIVGTRYGERDLGTNAVGTALVEERAIIIGTGQHFLSRYSSYVSVGAPIFAPDGRNAGALFCAIRSGGAAASARNRLALMVVGAFARRIGIELFATSFPGARFVQAMPDGSWPCALLAVDADDTVLGATRSARRLLGLTERRFAGSIGLRDLMERPDPSTRPNLDDLAGAEARLIAKAMTRHANKRSAVAKALGISRSTLYRKLQANRSGAIDIATTDSPANAFPTSREI